MDGPQKPDLTCWFDCLKLLTLQSEEPEKLAKIHIDKPCIWTWRQCLMESLLVPAIHNEDVAAEQSQGKNQQKIHRCEQNYPHEEVVL